VRCDDRRRGKFGYLYMIIGRFAPNVKVVNTIAAQTSALRQIHHPDPHRNHYAPLATIQWASLGGAGHGAPAPPSEHEGHDVASVDGIFWKLLSVPPRRLHRAGQQIALSQRHRHVVSRPAKQLCYTKVSVGQRAWNAADEARRETHQRDQEDESAVGPAAEKRKARESPQLGEVLRACDVLEATTTRYDIPAR
jgi:hypothetical protein